MIASTGVTTVFGPTLSSYAGVNEEKEGKTATARGRSERTQPTYYAWGDKLGACLSQAKISLCGGIINRQA